MARRRTRALLTGPALTASLSQVSEDHYEEALPPPRAHYREETPDNDTVISESMLGDQDMLTAPQYSVGGRKRKRGGRPDVGPGLATPNVGRRPARLLHAAGFGRQLHHAAGYFTMATMTGEPMPPHATSLRREDAAGYYHALDD